MPGYGMVFPPPIAGVSLTGMIHLLVSDVVDILIGGWDREGGNSPPATLPPRGYAGTWCHRDGQGGQGSGKRQCLFSLLPYCPGRRFHRPNLAGTTPQYINSSRAFSYTSAQGICILRNVHNEGIPWDRENLQREN